MLVGLRERTPSKSFFWRYIELLMSGAQNIMLHAYRGMALSDVAAFVADVAVTAVAIATAVTQFWFMSFPTVATTTLSSRPH